ncbi:hypothetical protein [Neobacillus niacini]|uniref:hypothetical protein n=1 Tax=Neobacillus niacini TaxID=86668 RepID=UPI0039838F60
MGLFEGCTPGFWRQPQHLDSWIPTGFEPLDDFDATFNVNFFDPNITLLQAVNLGGGGIEALARHAVAALLNSAHPDVDYPLSTTDVINLVQGIDPTNAQEVEDLKDLFEGFNELGCPLD